MDYIDKVLEKMKEWARKLIEALLGPDVPARTGADSHPSQRSTKQTLLVGSLDWEEDFVRGFSAARAKSKFIGSARTRNLW